MPDLSAVCRAFGLGEPVTNRVVARGAMGEIHRVETVDHQHRRRTVALKRAFWGATDEAAVAVEVDFVRRCVAAGVRAPEPIPTLDGTWWYEIAGPDGVVAYRCHGFVEGRPGTADDPTPVELVRWAARMHRLEVDARAEHPEHPRHPERPVPPLGPVDPWYVRCDVDWDALVVHAERADVWWAARLRDALAALHDLTALVAAASASEPVLAHRDLGPANLIHTGDGPVLLDWENCGPLPPERELAGLLVAEPPQRQMSLYRAYVDEGGPGRIDDVDAFATAASIGLNFLGEQAAVLLDPAAAEHHGFAAGVVDRMLAVPVATRSGYQRIVAELAAVTV